MLKGKSFWFRFTISFGVGHVAGAFGYAFTLLVIVLLMPKTPASSEIAFEYWQIPLLLMMYVSTLMFFSLALAIMMLNVTMFVAPVAAFAAVRLNAGRPRTTLYGALVGLFMGWPLARGLYGSELVEISTVPCALAAGAMFAQPIWAWCIRPRLTPSPAAASKPVPPAASVVVVTALVALLVITVLATAFGI